MGHMTNGKKYYFIIEGIASTDAEDSFGEVINQKGIDLSLVQDNLVKINLEHGDEFPLPEMAVVGLVTDAKIKKERLWIKGKIYFAHQYANTIYNQLRKNTGEIQLSVEMADCEYGDGKFSNIVLRGQLTAVALTNNPANDETHVKLSKSVDDKGLKILLSELKSLRSSLDSLHLRRQRKKRIIVKVLKVA